MNARKVILICLTSALAAAAQSAPPSQRVSPDSAAPAVHHPLTPRLHKLPAQSAPAKAAPVKGAPVKSAPVKAAPMKAAPAKAVPAKTVPMKKSAPVKAMKKVAQEPVQSAAVKEPEKKAVANRRDPFVSPVREGGPTGGPTCSVGKKCLAIDSILLRGIVQAPNGVIAVVESSARRATYFLRENDPVFNGVVVKITPDSIVFRENVMDRLGNLSTRDVVKRMSVAPAV